MARQISGNRGLHHRTRIRAWSSQAHDRHHQGERHSPPPPDKTGTQITAHTPIFAHRIPHLAWMQIVHKPMLYYTSHVNANALVGVGLTHIDKKKT